MKAASIQTSDVGEQLAGYVPTPRYCFDRVLNDCDRTRLSKTEEKIKARPGRYRK